MTREQLEAKVADLNEELATAKAAIGELGDHLTATETAGNKVATELAEALTARDAFRDEAAAACKERDAQAEQIRELCAERDRLQAALANPAHMDAGMVAAPGATAAISDAECDLLDKAAANTAAGEKATLWDKFNALTDSKARVAFWRQNEAAMQAELQTQNKQS